MATYKGRDVAIIEEVLNDRSKVRIRTEALDVITVNKSEVTIYDPKDIPEPKKDPSFEYRYPSKEEEEVYLKLKALKLKEIKEQTLKDERQAARKMSPNSGKPTQPIAKPSTSGTVVPALAPGEYAKLRADKAAAK